MRLDQELKGVVPRLVKDAETGNLCLQVMMGTECATHELPSDFGGWDNLTKEIHIERVVGEMLDGLRKRKPNKRRRY